MQDLKAEFPVSHGAQAKGNFAHKPGARFNLRANKMRPVSGLRSLLRYGRGSAGEKELDSYTPLGI